MCDRTQDIADFDADTEKARAELKRLTESTDPFLQKRLAEGAVRALEWLNDLESVPPRTPSEHALDEAGQCLETSARRVWEHFGPDDKLWWLATGRDYLCITSSTKSSTLTGLPMVRAVMRNAHRPPPMAVRLILYDIWGKKVQSLAWWDSQTDDEKRHVLKVQPRGTSGWETAVRAVRDRGNIPAKRTAPAVDMNLPDLGYPGELLEEVASADTTAVTTEARHNLEEVAGADAAGVTTVALAAYSGDADAAAIAAAYDEIEAAAAAAAHDDDVVDDDTAPAHDNEADTPADKPDSVIRRDNRLEGALIEFITDQTSATFLNELAARLGVRGFDAFHARMAVVNYLTTAILQKPNWDVDMSTHMGWERAARDIRQRYPWIATSDAIALVSNADRLKVAPTDHELDCWAKEYRTFDPDWQF